MDESLDLPTALYTLCLLVCLVKQLGLFNPLVATALTEGDRDLVVEDAEIISTDTLLSFSLSFVFSLLYHVLLS